MSGIRSTAAEHRRGALRRRDLLGGGHPGPPRPDRRRRRCRARVPSGRRRRRPGRRPAPPTRAAPEVRRPRHWTGCRSRSRTCWPPRGWRPPAAPASSRVGCRRTTRRSSSAAARRRPADPRQDQHGRVRDGLVHRALGVRAHPQPLGPRPDPRRLRRRVGRGRRGVRGAARDRHRHRRLDPAARRGDRHRRGEADLRRGVALRARRAGQQPRPGGPGHPDRPRRRTAPRGGRRPRPARLHLASTRPLPDLVGAARQGASGDVSGLRVGVVQRADRRGLPGRRAAALRRGGRAARRRGRRGRRGVLPDVRARPRGLLPDPAGRGLLQPREVRRDAVRPEGAPRRRRGAECGGGDAGDPGPRLRRRGEAPDHPRHLRPVQRLLRRLLRQGAEGPHADQPGLRGRLRARRRAGLADRADHRVQAGREARRPGRDVPQRPRHHPRQPLRRARHLGAQRPRRRGRPAHRRAGAGTRDRRRPGLPRRRRPREAADRPVGRPADRPGAGAGWGSA